MTTASQPPPGGPAVPERVAPSAYSALPWKALDAATISYVRCILAVAGIGAIWIDPTEPARLAMLTYGSLGAYVLYAFVVMAVSRRSAWSVPPRFLHWVDIGFYGYLICLTEATQSVFFFCFFFPIMVASFSYGFREGCAATLAAAGSFLTLGLATMPWQADVPWTRALVRPVYLLALGYLMSFFGGRQVEHGRQQLLVHSLQTHRNPRLGVQFKVSQSLTQLCDFYGAEAGILIVPAASGSTDHTIYSAFSTASGKSHLVDKASNEVAVLLLRAPPDQALLYSSRGGMWKRRSRCFVLDASGKPVRPATRPEWFDELANFLDVRSYISVPCEQRGAMGRLILAGNGVFLNEDVSFVLHFAETLAIVVDNTQLVEELVSTASEHERARLSLDIHDHTIQPYIGLRIGLGALQRKAAAEPIKDALDDLMAIADATVRDLRDYAAALRQTGPAGENMLVSAIEEQAVRYKRFYGTTIDIDMDGVSPIGGRAATELFNIVLEALTNIRKHTRATKAFVRLVREGVNLRLQIGNENTDATVLPFTPHTIQERARALGGRVAVATSGGYTIVDVDIPI